MQIGFEQTSYTVHEGDKSVTVCAVKTAGDIVTPVPVTFFTVDGLSAQGMHTHGYQCITIISWLEVECNYAILISEM